MGIFRLTSYIEKHHETYFKNHLLINTLIIIDGPGLTHFLYNKNNKNNETCPFGGDYDVIANTCREFIHKLSTCNLTPIFVFDGGYEDRKIKNIENRLISRIKLYSKPFKSNRCVPYFNTDIIIDVLNEMDLPHITCNFEADAEIVTLAKLLNCPIIGQDSDYFVSTVPYIPLNKIDLKFSKNGIACQIYKVENLLNKYGGLNVDYLPLIPVLLGNDYIELNVFNGLTNESGTNDYEIKMKKVTHWLSRQSNLNGAIENMMKYLNEKESKIIHNQNYNISKQELLNKDEILIKINTIVQQHNNESSEYLEYILEYNIMRPYKDLLQNNYLKSDEKSILPHWLKQNYRKGTVSSIVMTLLTMKNIHFSVQIEDFNQRPYYEISFNILERILGLLNIDSIAATGRKGFGLDRFEIKSFINRPYVVSLADLNQTDLKYRKNIILDLVGIKTFNGFPKEWELFILVVIYWAKRTNGYKTSHTHALILNAMTSNIITKMCRSQNQTFKDSRATGTTKSIIEYSLNKVKKEDCENAMNNLSQYFVVSRYNNQSLYHKIIHPFAQFQSCVYFIMVLNSLLDFPYDRFCIEHFFKGSFLYNLCVNMENCNPEVFVAQNLFVSIKRDNNMNSLNRVYKSIISHIDTLMSVSKKDVNATA